MNMVIDIGNSTTKVGIFEGELLREKQVFDNEASLVAYLSGRTADNLIVCSVTNVLHEAGDWVKVAFRKIYLEPGLSLPIVNRYATPSTLGVDRLAAACGAWSLFQGQACLVIDAGTCINYEFVNAQGAYEGGAISPGVRMRFEAMHQLTAKLPRVNPVPHPPITGNDTTSCMQSGVMHGITEEIRGVMARYNEEHPGVRVILCGGDAHFFENHLKPSIFVAPDLVLMGLNSILMHHVK